METREKESEKSGKEWHSQRLRTREPVEQNAWVIRRAEGVEKELARRCFRFEEEGDGCL